MKREKIFFFALPVLAGILCAWLVLPKLSRGEAAEEKPIKRKIEASETPVPFEKTVPKSISHYLLSSQTLFSKSIELSRAKGDNSSDLNTRIVQLINEAVTQATEAILHYPTDPRGYAQRAKIYQAIEKYLPEAIGVALVDWEKAASLAPRESQYLKAVSDLALKIGDYQKALFYLKKASETAPTEAQILFDLAQLENKLGLLAEAEKDYQRVFHLLVDQEQKKIVEKELKAIRILLAAASDEVIERDESKDPLSATGRGSEISLPDSPPTLEANNLTNRVVLADPSEKKDLLSENFTDSNAFSGIGILPGGETEVVIMNNIINNSSQVYLTPLGESQNQVLRVSRKRPAKEGQPGSFTVAIPQALNHDLEFKWWIIN